ncbi:MAG: putative sulfate exporter family transporter [Gammaproteobacteria bacterium]
MSASRSAVTPLDTARAVAPGLAIAVTVAMAAQFVAEHYGGPVMLLALLLGMAFNFLSEPQARTAAGIEFSSKRVLRLGVALLGLRITFEDIAALGTTPVVMVVAGVSGTIAVGLVLSALLRLPRSFGVLTAGATAICGASAALAISAVLPKHPALERDTVFTVVAVTGLSTIAMVVYPLIVSTFVMDDTTAGIFLGGTIHDVAQVVGAGYMVSQEAGDVATFTKLLRVSLLVPVVFLILAVTHRRSAGTGGTLRSTIPVFLIAFVVLVVAGSYGWVPESLRDWLIALSRGCLVTAIAALGMKTSLKDLAAVGPKAIGLVVAETVCLALFFLAVLS